MRTAGGRYAYVAPVMEGGGAEADEVPAPGLPRIEMASLDAAQDVEPSPRPTPILVPIQGPLNLEGRYLGDLSGAVDPQGAGVVDTTRLLELLKPVINTELFDILSTLSAGQERIAMADLRSDDFSLTFDPLSLSFNAVLASTARMRREIGLGNQEVVDPAAFDQPARFAAGANISLAQLYSHQSDAFAPALASIDGFATWGGFGGLTLTAGADYDGSGGDEKWRRREVRLTKEE
jgi:hypothetical protein